MVCRARKLKDATQNEHNLLVAIGTYKNIKETVDLL